MERYVAFFRSINVGGKNKAAMAELKQMFADLGLVDARTYLQSGNVVFSSAQDKAMLTALLRPAFESRFGFRSEVILRTGAELAAILAALPFSMAEIQQAQKQAPDVEHLYVYLADTALDQERIRQLCAGYDGEDKLFATEYEIYLLCSQSIRNSRLAAALTKLPQPLTARNLNTMGKLVAML